MQQCEYSDHIVEFVDKLSVMDKTRDLTARSAGLTSNLRGYLNDVRRAKIAKEKKAREELEGY
eukprot:scaffold18377_cov69-Cyclotella_meneghiniana.AAC.1